MSFFALEPHRDSGKRAILSVDDGIVDLAFGLLLMTIGMTLLTDLVALTGPFVVIIIVFAHLLKQRITALRPPVEEATDDRATVRRAGAARPLLIALVTGLLFLGILGLLFARAEPDRMAPVGGVYLLYGIIVTTLLAYAAWATGIARYVVFAALMLPALLLCLALSIDLPVALIFLGSILTLSGIVLLARFVRSRPLP